MKQILENMHKHGYILKMFCSTDGFSAEFIKDQNVEYVGRRIGSLEYLESVLHSITLVRSIAIVKSLTDGKFILNYVTPISFSTLWHLTMFAAIKEAASRIRLLTVKEMITKALSQHYHLYLESNSSYRFVVTFSDGHRSWMCSDNNYETAIRGAYDNIN